MWNNNSGYGNNGCQMNQGCCGCCHKEEKKQFVCHCEEVQRPQQPCGCCQNQCSFCGKNNY